MTSTPNRTALILALSGALLRAQVPGVTLSASSEHATIIAGEPLFLTVTLANHSAENVSLRTDAGGFVRSLIAPDGKRIELPPPMPTNPDTAYFLKNVAPDTKEAVHLVATEIAHLRQPGEYKMRIAYPPLQEHAELNFILQPYDAPALHARAQEIYVAAAKPDTDTDSLNQIALTAVDPAIAQPLMCELIKRSPEILIVRRLQQLGDARSIECLIDAFPNSHGIQREVLTDALTQLARRSPDQALRDKVAVLLQH